jgi:hypothetical protein
MERRIFLGGCLAVGILTKLPLAHATDWASWLDQLKNINDTDGSSLVAGAGIYSQEGTVLAEHRLFLGLTAIQSIKTCYQKDGSVTIGKIEYHKTRVDAEKLFFIGGENPLVVNKTKHLLLLCHGYAGANSDAIASKMNHVYRALAKF